MRGPKDLRGRWGSPQAGTRMGHTPGGPPKGRSREQNPGGLDQAAMAGETREGALQEATVTPGKESPGPSECVIRTPQQSTYSRGSGCHLQSASCQQVQWAQPVAGAGGMACCTIICCRSPHSQDRPPAMKQRWPPQLPLHSLPHLLKEDVPSGSLVTPKQVTSCRW